MSIQKHLPFLGLVFLLSVAAYLTVFDAPSTPVQGIIFTSLCLLYSGWLTVRQMRGRDEVKSAASRFAIMLGAGGGMAFAVLTVAVMRAVPAVADFVTHLAAGVQNGLSPASTGFAFGVFFTVVLMVLFYLVGLFAWWLRTR